MHLSLRKTVQAQGRKLFTNVYTNQELIDKDLKYFAHNYKPLPVGLSKSQGIYVRDENRRKYLDFLCGFSSNNKDHSLKDSHE